VGLAGKSDAEIFRHAFANDFSVVTINAADFITLAAGCDLHPGLVVLRVMGLTAEEQWGHLLPVLEHLAKQDDPNALTNRVIEVTGVGKFKSYPLPPE